MKVSDFIENCSRSINDKDYQVISSLEWLEILNFHSGELFPDIGYRGTITGTIASLGTEYQLSLKDYPTLEDVKEVYLEDASGNKFLYDNWVYFKELQLLDLDPETSKTPSLSISNYKKYHVIWVGYVPEFSSTTAEIELDPPKLILLQKICIREALERILNDHAKLDRYRTLIGRMNEYALLARIDRLTTDIELKKRRLADTRQVRSF